MESNMNDFSTKVIQTFEQMDFEVQPVSFKDLTASGEMAELGN
jgi:hypothetical protein